MVPQCFRAQWRRSSMTDLWVYQSHKKSMLYFRWTLYQLILTHMCRALTRRIGAASLPHISVLFSNSNLITLIQKLDWLFLSVVPAYKWTCASAWAGAPRISIWNVSAVHHCQDWPQTIPLSAKPNNYRAQLKGGHQIWWAFLLLLLTTSAWLYLKHSRNLWPAF